MKVYPVIHIQSEFQAQEETQVALDAGADGVFVIAMNGDDVLAMKVAKKLLDYKYENFRIGVNLLEAEPSTASFIASANNLHMCWTDYKPANDEYNIIAQDIDMYTGYDFFASFAFKYQPIEMNPVQELNRLYKFGFIPVTSGTKTGAPPELQTIMDYRKLSNTDKLGIASGLSPDNIAQFKPYITHALISTGISKDFYHFDEDLIKRFIDIAKAP